MNAAQIYKRVCGTPQVGGVVRHIYDMRQMMLISDRLNAADAPRNAKVFEAVVKLERSRQNLCRIEAPEAVVARPSSRRHQAQTKSCAVFAPVIMLSHGNEDAQEAVKETRQSSRCFPAPRKAVSPKLPKSATVSARRFKNEAVLCTELSVVSAEQRVVDQLVEFPEAKTARPRF